MGLGLVRRLHSWLTRTSSRIFQRWLSSSSMSPNSWVLLANVYARLFLKGHRFHLHEAESLYELSDGVSTRFFPSRSRGLHIYKLGIQHRAEFLYNSYCLGNIDFDGSDVVIDCGANYGDLWLGLENKLLAKNYIAIEPNPDDFRALERNVPKGANLLQAALAEEDGSVSFFLSGESGDSSVIRPDSFTGVITVNAISLNRLVQDLNLTRVKLLKIEAEGFEPEILRGGIESLDICEWVAVDGGPERGIERQQTLSDVSNILYSRGFIMADFWPDWSRALFRNSGYEL